MKWVGSIPIGNIPLRSELRRSAQIEQTLPTHFDAVSTPSEAGALVVRRLSVEGGACEVDAEAGDSNQ